MINYACTSNLLSIYPVAGISVKEHLEVNVVPLAVSLTAKFFQTVQDFFVPKAEEGVALGDTYTSGEPDHSHLFGPTGVQRRFNARTHTHTYEHMHKINWHYLQPLRPMEKEQTATLFF